MTITEAKKKETTLIIGHAGRHRDHGITLDIEPEHNPDVLHDLNKTPYPFKDNQFKEINCHHVLEHLNDLTEPLKELHRICDKEGSIYIEVPHHSAWFAKTPEHKLLFNYFSFDGYIENGVTKWIVGKKFKLLRREVTFHRTYRQIFLHKIFNRSPLAYERFWTALFPAEHLKFWLQPIK